jgi:LL-diaminopimelate aminotransferase
MHMKIGPAKRVSNIGDYFFAQRGRRVAELRAEGLDVIRMDIGSPDMPPARHIVDAMVNSAYDAGHHGYSPAGGTAEFRAAVQDYYRRRFGVELDEKSEILGLIGSKEGVFHLAQAVLDPGDLALVPDPGYLVYPRAAQIAAAELVRMPLREASGYLPDLGALPGPTPGRRQVLWVNYPNNPTGAAAPIEFFERLIDYGRRSGVLICHDAPYVEVAYEGYRPPSILQVSGAKEVAVEFNSLSKSYNMAGWRLGMAVGNAAAIGALFTYKSQVDSSHFQPIMDAGVAALRGDQSWLQERNAIYRERRDLILTALKELGMHAPKPAAGLYVWARLPEGDVASMPYSERLLEQAGVSFAPGVAFGAFGEGYLRISMTAPTDRLEEALARFVNWARARQGKHASDPPLEAV